MGDPSATNDTLPGYILIRVAALRAFASRLNFDRIGTYASAICAVHCLLTGVAIGLLSVAGLGMFGSIWADIAFLSVAVAIALIAIVHGHRRHHSIIPAQIFVLGLVFIVIGHFVVRHTHGGVGHTDMDWDQVVSTSTSVLGGLCLVLFHVVNQRMQHKCGCTHCSHH